jgi:hypothetical protein
VARRTSALVLLSRPPATTAAFRQLEHCPANLVPAPQEARSGLVPVVVARPGLMAGAAGMRVWLIGPECRGNLCCTTSATAAPGYLRPGRGAPASGAKSDAADAHLLAEIVRLDRAHHPPVAGNSPAGPGGQADRPPAPEPDLGPARQVLRLRAALREFFPAALESACERRSGHAAGLSPAAPPAAARGPAAGPPRPRSQYRDDLQPSPSPQS